MTTVTPYKQQVIDFYDKRLNYDNKFTIARALKVLDLIPLQQGQQILDVATGTAIVALAAAEKVASEGKVIAVDITAGMLSQARHKIELAGINNIELIEADIEMLNFEQESFDVIFCSSAIVLLSNIPVALSQWHDWLKKGGWLAFSCYSESSYFTPLITGICESAGISLPNVHEPLGTPEKCYSLLEKTGFRNIDIKTIQLGKYLSISEAKQLWQGDWIHPQDNPLLKLTPEEIKCLIEQYKTKVDLLATPAGIWHDITTFLVTGCK